MGDNLPAVRDKSFSGGWLITFDLGKVRLAVAGFGSRAAGTTAEVRAPFLGKLPASGCWPFPAPPHMSDQGPRAGAGLGPNRTEVYCP